MYERSWLRRAVVEPWRAPTWKNFGYALVGLPIGLLGFAFTIVTLAVSTALLITFIGLPMLALSGMIARWYAGQMRRLANGVLAAGVAPPFPLQHRPGLLGWLASAVKDSVAWRARLYLVLKLPVGLFGFVCAVAFWGYGLAR
jgi:Putative sensor